ncbi:hypothetical protein KIN20_023881 [Parelaphostrongylus tenuis]|uniref:Uncharacterized protein n=1 Tax=Parelaphostrongylus tenuis TaxID=148309 RepID=A0AAD5MSP3_PARTN|nr:hypothetical protein KIN20_023881 [Parelaphostrongylus tenuis]
MSGCDCRTGNMWQITSFQTMQPSEDVEQPSVMLHVLAHRLNQMMQMTSRSKFSDYSSRDFPIYSH